MKNIRCSFLCTQSQVDQLAAKMHLCKTRPPSPLSLGPSTVPSAVRCVIPESVILPIERLVACDDETHCVDSSVQHIVQQYNTLFILTGALHFLHFQFSPPPPSSLAAFDSHFTKWLPFCVTFKNILQEAGSILTLSWPTNAQWLCLYITETTLFRLTNTVCSNEQ